MNYTVIRTKRKTTSLEINNRGEIVIHAPLNYTDSQAADFIQRENAWIEKRLPSIINKRNLLDALTEKEIKEIRKNARDFIIPYCVNYAERLNIKPTKISVNSAKSRFGSCSADNSIRFSLYLMLYPFDGLEYVVVHELMHIIHHDHSTLFHNELRKILPDEHRRELLLRPENISIDNIKTNRARISEILHI